MSTFDEIDDQHDQQVVDILRGLKSGPSPARREALLFACGVSQGKATSLRRVKHGVGMGLCACIMTFVVGVICGGRWVIPGQPTADLQAEMTAPRNAPLKKDRTVDPVRQTSRSEVVRNDARDTTDDTLPISNEQILFSVARLKRDMTQSGHPSPTENWVVIAAAEQPPLYAGQRQTAEEW